MNIKSFSKIMCVFMIMFCFSASTVYAQDLVPIPDTYNTVYPANIEEPLVINCENLSLVRGTETVWSNSYSVYSLRKPFVLTWDLDDSPVIKVKVTNTGTTDIQLVAYQGTSPTGGINEIDSLIIPSSTTKTLSFAGSATWPSLSEDIWTSGFTLSFVDAEYLGNIIEFDVVATVTI